jgi:FkbM family methyltransferase
MFEPQPEAANQLRARFGGEHRVSLHETALSDAPGRASLWADFPGSGLASLNKRRLDHFGRDMSHRVEVPTTRLDDWARTAQIQRIEWMKLDVEGHELSVLRGMGDLIRSVDLVQFEFGGCNIDSRTFFQDFWYFFEKHRFAIHRMTPRGPIEIHRYDESLECFRTTNYVALARDRNPAPG